MSSLLLDLDGTLTDPQEGIIRCIQHALETNGYTAPNHEELLWCIGPPLHVSFAQLNPEADEKKIWELIAKYRERFATHGMFENKVYEGIPELLARFQDQGHKLYLATSKPHFFARPILEHFSLDHFFKGIYGSELDGNRSDKGQLIEHILKTEKLEATTTLMIGDRKHDVAGAKKNQIKCAGVTWGYGSKEELSVAGADHIVDNLPALETYCNEVMSFFAR